MERIEVEDLGELLGLYSGSNLRDFLALKKKV